MQRVPPLVYVLMLKWYQMIQTKLPADSMRALLNSTDVKLLLEQQIRRFVEGPARNSWCIKSLDSIEIEASWAGQKIREFAATDLKVASLISECRLRIVSSGYP